MSFLKKRPGRALAATAALAALGLAGIAGGGAALAEEAAQSDAEASEIALGGESVEDQVPADPGEGVDGPEVTSEEAVVPPKGPTELSDSPVFGTQNSSDYTIEASFDPASLLVLPGAEGFATLTVTASEELDYDLVSVVVTGPDDYSFTDSIDTATAPGTKFTFDLTGLKAGTYEARAFASGNGSAESSAQLVVEQYEFTAAFDPASVTVLPGGEGLGELNVTSNHEVPWNLGVTVEMNDQTVDGYILEGKTTSPIIQFENVPVGTYTAQITVEGCSVDFDTCIKDTTTADFTVEELDFVNAAWDPATVEVAAGSTGGSTLNVTTNYPAPWNLDVVAEVYKLDDSDVARAATPVTSVEGAIVEGGDTVSFDIDGLPAGKYIAYADVEGCDAPNCLYDTASAELTITEETVAPVTPTPEKPDTEKPTSGGLASTGASVAFVIAAGMGMLGGGLTLLRRAKRS